MRRILMLLVFFLMSAPLQAQRLNIDFPGLADRAAETVDVTLDGPMLRLASKFLSDDDSAQRAARDIVRNLTGIYVRSYEFDKEGEYDRSIVDRVRTQLGPSWQKIVNVRSRLKENVEIYVDSRGDNPAGLLIISADPKELTVVNLVGPIDLDRLSSLEGEFGIPHISKSKDKEKEKSRD